MNPIVFAASVVSAGLTVDLAAINRFLIQVVLPGVFFSAFVFSICPASAMTEPSRGNISLAIQQVVTVIPQEIAHSHGGLRNLPKKIVDYYEGLAMLKFYEDGICAARNSRDLFISIPQINRNYLEDNIVSLAQRNIERGFMRQVLYVNSTNETVHEAGIEPTDPLFVRLKEKVRIFSERRANGLPDEID